MSKIINKHLEVFGMLDGLLAMQPAKPNSKTTMVLKPGKGGDQRLYIRADSLLRVVDNTVVTFLKKEGLLVNAGAPRKLEVAGKRGDWIGIEWTELQRKADETEKVAAQAQRSVSTVLSLERQLKRLREQNMAETAALEFIRELQRRADKAVAGAKPMAPVAKIIKQMKADPNIATLMISDTHYGEVVDPRQMQYTNEYSVDIADRRLRRVFTTAMNLAARDTDRVIGFCLALGGDMSSGEIHAELAETNEMFSPEAVIHLGRQLADGILMLAKHFPSVYVPCVSGNHGRMTTKPQAKNRFRNMDWMLYHIIRDQVCHALGDKCNVKFEITEGSDVRYDLFDTGFLLTHGDQFQTRGGVGGIYPGLMRTDALKRKKASQANIKPWHYTIMGHWHTYGQCNSIFTNGSLKGYDEYVASLNLPFEPPQQAMWLTSRDYGVHTHIAVRGDEVEKPNRDKLALFTPERELLREAISRYNVKPRLEMF